MQNSFLRIILMIIVSIYIGKHTLKIDSIENNPLVLCEQTIVVLQ